MSNYRARPSRPDRAKAIAAVVAVHAAMGALLLIRPDMVRDPPPDLPSTVLIDIQPPAPPPPQAPQPGRARDEQGAAGKKAEPTQIVAPPPRLPAPTPLPAAPIAGTGSASTAGAAQSGDGPGAGGSGTGRGGGGSGGGGGIGVPARLISGGLTRSDYRSIRGVARAASSGRARLAIMVGPDGRVATCSIANSSGNSEIDATLCAIVQPRMRWAAARDTAGNPISVGVYYIATWQRY